MTTPCDHTANIQITTLFRTQRERERMTEYIMNQHNKRALSSVMNSALPCVQCSRCDAYIWKQNQVCPPTCCGNTVPATYVPSNGTSGFMLMLSACNNYSADGTVHNQEWVCPPQPVHWLVTCNMNDSQLDGVFFIDSLVGTEPKRIT